MIYNGLQNGVNIVYSGSLIVIQKLKAVHWHAVFCQSEMSNKQKDQRTVVCSH